MSGLEERVAGLALGDDGSREAALRRLQGCGDARVGWPREKPGVAANAEGWFLRANEDVLRDLVPRGGLVFELGSYIGKSTRFLCSLVGDAGHVVTCDAWDNDLLENALGHNYLREDAEKRGFPLYETFLVNLWDLKEVVTPLKMLTVDAIAATEAAGLEPDVVYVDADHDYEGVRRDVELCLAAFPGAVVVGDDWDYAGVREAAQELRGGRPLHVGGFKCWCYAALPRRGGIHVPAHEAPRAMGDVAFWPDAPRSREPRSVLLFRVIFDTLQAWDNAEALAWYLEATDCPPNLASPSHKQRSLIMIAALFGRPRAIRVLADRGADVDARAPTSGEHALQLAAYGGRLEAVRALLDLGAATTLRTKYDETAEDAARANGQHACAELLRTGGVGEAPLVADAHLTRVVKADKAKGKPPPWFDIAATSTYPTTRTTAPPRPEAAPRSSPAPWRRGGRGGRAPPPSRRW